MASAGERIVFELSTWSGTLSRRTELEILGRDAHGLWCGAAAGHHVSGPAGATVIDMPVVFLFPAGQWWVARHFPDGGWKVDIATPVERQTNRLVARDLDLDVRRLHGRTWVEDQDEFAVAGYPADTANAAAASCAEIEQSLVWHAPPFDVTGDRWLAQLNRRTPQIGGRRAVFFDMGGVLLCQTSTAGYDRWCDRLGVDREQLVRHIQEAIGGGWEAGRQPEQILASLAERLGLEIGDADTLLADLHGCETLDADLVSFATSLPPAITVGIISNNGADVRRYWDGIHQLGARFAPIVISGEERVAKPDPRIYEIAAARAGAEPEHCVFVDDAERNVIAAHAAGMHAIHHTDTATTIEALEKELG